MSNPPRQPGRGRGKKVRVPFRRNRAKPAREGDWTKRVLDGNEEELDTQRGESIVAKGGLSRRRTIIVPDGEAEPSEDLRCGTVVAMRGLFADVDDGQRIRPCTVRRILRTRLIRQRHPVTVGDRVLFRSEPDTEGVQSDGVIEVVQPRTGELLRRSGRRIHTIVANVDHAIIVSSAAEPYPKLHLIDRYIVASHAGDITPVICMNKIDLDTDGRAQAQVNRYADLGYTVLRTSIVSGEGIEALREVLRDKACVVAGQSGVGKSSLLNAVQPGLKLQVGDVIEQTQKGRHTTTTAILLRLQIGGYVVDTPGVRSFDLSVVDRNEFEAYFVEFVERLKNCKFADCTHTHEIDCAIKRAVETGEIHPDRYESYVNMFEEPTEPDWKGKLAE